MGLQINFAVFILCAIIKTSSSQFAGNRGSRRQFAQCDKLSSSSGREYLLDPESGGCHQLGSQGPCGPLMTFYRHPTKPKIGFCDCQQGHVDLERPCADHPIRRRIYSPQNSRCYTVFSQGPCDPKDWFVLDEDQGSGLCVPNPCQKLGPSREKDEQFWFYDPRIGSCHKSFTSGYCSAGEHLELVHTSQYPVCKRPTCSGSLAFGIIRSASVSCTAGSRFSFLTRSCRGFYGRFRSIG